MKRQEIRFIYNSQKKRDREAYGLIKALNKYVINEFDIIKNQMTETQLAELADKLPGTIDDLFDERSDLYDEKFKSISDEDKLIIINATMSLLKTPIVVWNNDTATILKTPFDIHPIDLEIEGTKKTRM